MEDLINGIADLCSQRDRDALDSSMVLLLHKTCQERVHTVRLVRFLANADEVRCLNLAQYDAKLSALSRQRSGKDWDDLPLLESFPDRLHLRTSGKPIFRQGDPCMTVLPLGDRHPLASCIELESAEPLPASMVRIVQGIALIYQNYEGLLDYGEKDALTDLLNRKTFDGAFLKAAVELAEPAEKEATDRRAFHAAEGYWLAVLDIDHFKRVNDNFGHLIGDEVLLLMARLMRTGFRFHDQLYRFGGEEFVILMRCAHAEDAAGALERFRAMVQAYEFPQVGTITVSIGFAALRGQDTPGGAFDRADKAVYYAKGHGRNQVRSYEDLVMCGELIEEVEESKDVDFF